jgi:hypothetical protein
MGDVVDDKLLPSDTDLASKVARHGVRVNQPVRLLCVFAAAGFERRVERLLAEQAGQPPLERSAAEPETRILGPPP